MEDIFKIIVALGAIIYYIVSATKKAPKKTIYYDPPKKKETATPIEDGEENSFDRDVTVMQEYALEPEPEGDYFSGYESDDTEQYNFGSYESLETISVNEYSPTGADSMMASRNMADLVAAAVNEDNEVEQNNERPDIDLKKAIIYQTILERKYV